MVFGREMQSSFKNIPDWRISMSSQIPNWIIEAVAATVRTLADYRFGSNELPLLSSHTDLSQWSLTDVVVIWHGYRYGSASACGAKRPRARVLKTLNTPKTAITLGEQGFKDGYSWETMPNAAFVRRFPFLQCYMDRCD